MDLVNDHQNLANLYDSLSKISTRRKDMSIDNWINQPGINHNLFRLPEFSDPASDLHYSMPRRIDWTLMRNIYDTHPSTYEEFLSIPGVGPSTIRAVSLIAELIFGSKTSWNDPVKFTFAHGEKMGYRSLSTRKIMMNLLDFYNRVLKAQNFQGERDSVLSKN